MSATLFAGGTIWTGTGDVDALLISGGVVREGAQARNSAPVRAKRWTSAGDS